MKPLTTLFLVGLLLFVGSVAASANTIFSLANFTLSGGDPVFSIASDITFTNLEMTVTYADTATFAQSLGSLNTTDFSLDSISLANADPAHGAIINATLTGNFSQTNGIVTQQMFGGTTTNANINGSFTADFVQALGAGAAQGAIANGTATVNIVATDADNPATTYGAGVLFALTAPNAPEPASLCLLGAAFGAVALRRRKR